MKTPRPKIPIAEVVDWLCKNHPTLDSETERQWRWVTTPLDPTKPNDAVAILSIESCGFRKSVAGHKLASGNIGRWGHACDAPTPFKRKPLTTIEDADAELKAFVEA